ncbi:MAG: hypothetical protein NWQ38_14620 [Cellulophaga sp.]|nr:hypothetical protein [Cellulophaga sp.]
MFNKKNILVVVFIWVALFAYAQKNEKLGVNTILSTVDQESVFVSYNSPILLAGESFFYKFYTTKNSNKPSDISKMGYVELVNDSFQIITRQKLQLVNGMGYGDIFIATNIPSGNYKLIGYTQWMKNWGVTSFFQSDITIINPFRADQSAILVDAVKNSKKLLEKISESSIDIRMSLSKNIFSKREKVLLALEAKSNDIKGGNYTMLVRKKESLNKPTAEQQSTSQNQIINYTPSNTDFFVPEMRGELLCGKIIAKKNQALIYNKKVALNILNTDYQLKIASTDNTGNFCISIADNPLDKKGVLQVLGDDQGEYEIVLHEKLGIDYKQLKFQKFELDASMEQAILERSVHNQIENAYYSVKPDTIKMPIKRLPFYGTVGTTFELDDYTRFPTFKETMIEIISDARLTKKGSDSYSILINGIHENYKDGGYKPLIIVDGIVVQDVNDLMDYNANKIKSITVVRDKYMVGAYVFAGIFDVITFEQDFAKNYNNSKTTNFNFNTNVNHKIYFKQQYTTENFESYRNIPDYRHQLYWDPEFSLLNSEHNIDFYTSDVAGIFEITIEGFTKSGKFIQIKKTFEVE